MQIVCDFDVSVSENPFSPLKRFYRICTITRGTKNMRNRFNRGLNRKIMRSQNKFYAWSARSIATLNKNHMSVVVLFNGIHFPLSVMDKAITYAKQTGDSLEGIFIEESEKKEGYGFPSDLDEAQELNTTEDAVTSDRRIIESNMKLLQHAAEAAGVSVAMRHLMDPAENEIRSELKGAAAVFVSSRVDEYTVAGLSSINLKGLFILLPVKVHYVND
jgi:hypothetical protein